jgi:hypothetical protein
VKQRNGFNSLDIYFCGTFSGAGNSSIPQEQKWEGW